MNELTTQAQDRITRFLERDHGLVSDAGRTILLSHGERRPRAFVLFHGLSASPTQFIRFARDLHARGHNVLVPRLPKHGHSDRLSDALARLTLEDLRRTAHESVAIGRDLGERVTIVGFSLGGLLTIWSALNEPVDRAVAIAPFLGVSWIPNSWMRPIAEVLLRLPNRFAWWNPIERERQLPEHGYPRFATHAIAQMYRLARLVLDDAEREIRAKQLVLVTNAREAAVNNRAVRRLLARLLPANATNVSHVELGDLPPSHDIIEPLRHVELADRVYPRLLELIDPQ